MKKRLTSFFLTLALSFSLCVPAFAVDDNQYYSLPSVASDSSPAMDWPTSLTATGDGWSSSDSSTLTNIYEYIQYLTLSPSSWQRNSIVGFLERILDRIPSNLSDNFGLQGLNRGTNVMLDEIAKWSMFSYNYLSSDNISGNLGNIQRNTLNTVDAVLKGNTFLSAISDKVATETTLKSFSDSFDNIFSYSGSWTSPTMGSGFVFPEIQDRNYVSYMSYPWVIGSLYSNFLYDGFQPYHNNPDDYTLYHFVKNLSLTLASDDDKQLAQNQKDNRNQVEQDFLTGSSGKTSLGKDDFGSLSSVGGTFKDISSLNGQASLDSFSSGLSDADTTGQGWFSQSTKNALDSVSGSTSSESAVSTFSDDGMYSVDIDPDPYNMGDFENNYAWLWGEN